MTILVDEARWPWRGTIWCHLVSDSNYGELHEFAARLGCRRVGFQGDHYDIDVDTRADAIALGAEPRTSRELVRAMKGAGLRIRPSSFQKWELLDEGTVLTDPIVTQFAELLTGSEAAVPHADRWFALHRGEARAFVIGGDLPADGGSPPWLPQSDEGSGRFIRTDRLGRWSVERITPPPGDHE